MQQEISDKIVTGNAWEFIEWLKEEFQARENSGGQLYRVSHSLPNPAFL